MTADAYADHRRDLDREIAELSPTAPSAPPSWITITELGTRHGFGPRQIRVELQRMGLLQPEVEVRMVPMIIDPTKSKPEYRTTLRLTRDAVVSGLGRRMVSRNDRIEFDVLSPEGQRWVEERLPARVPRKATLRDRIAALMSERPGIKQTEVSKLLGRSQQAVSYHMRQLVRSAA